MSAAKASDVEALLESAAQEQEARTAAANGSGDNASPTNNRDNRNDDRNGTRDRDGDRHRPQHRPHRELNGDRDRRSSRDRERKRRDPSKTRSSYKDTDTDEEIPDRTRNRHSSRDRTGHRSGRDDYRDRGRGGDHYRGGGRARSRSPGGRGHRDERSYRDRDEYRGRSGRERERERDRDRARDPPKPKKDPEPTDDERDRRTVFVQQLAARLRTRELEHFFTKIGPVKEAQIVKDRVSGRSKGVGYVEFKDEESVVKALELTGQKLLGIPIIVQLTEAEKNRQARVTEGANGNTNGVPFHRLYVGNIHFSITEDDLKSIFSPFGELEFIQLQREEGGRSKGYGFVQFVNSEDAKAALEQLNGFEIANRPIRVGLGNDKFTPESTANLLRNFNQGTTGYQGSSFSGAGGRGAHAGGAGGFDRASARDTDRGAGGASALDDTDVAGVNFNNYSRENLMMKLARRDQPEQPAGASATVATTITSNRPAEAYTGFSMASRSIKLSNVFNPDEETGENWIKEIEDDVRQECEKKFGKLVHIHLDPNSPGDIYLQFVRVSDGEKAVQGLNGRLFGGRMITASFMSDMIYSSMFGRPTTRNS
ncbi:splicing factor, CC1-like protein [Delitschia confertaspora ATCC 74209]|uniref:Splicing factor, CC1-like protein n=1 Tax=Delitschia confertaspora ATCC 74209 TaxID=1513339 RepID=A0A9P4MTS8_9PLEO|nr:splicing factor, CC1-like protein [Delitschia confertaspora ATCC 74209]